MFKAARYSFLIFLGLLYAAPAWAQRVYTYEEIQAIKAAPSVGSLIFQAIFLLIFAGLFLVPLHFAKRNMKGWEQPVKTVLFSFSGRLNRKAYWLKGFIPLVVINLCAQALIAVLQIPVVAVAGGQSAGLIVVAALVAIPMIVVYVWATFALTIKRAHDLNHSGWWLLTLLIPVYNIWVTIQLYFLRGFVGPNSYGADPIDPYVDYVEEMFGEQGAADDGADTPSGEPHARPRPPQRDEATAKGFGSAQFKAKPAPPREQAPAAEADDRTVRRSSGGNMDLIKRRLGGEVLRPVERKAQD